MTSSRHNHNQFAPSPFPAGDRRTNTIEAKLAENDVRRGRERVWEGTGSHYQSAAAGGFAEARSGATPNREVPGNVLGKKIADGRGPVGSGEPMQHWTDEREYLGGFVQGQFQRSATNNVERPGTVYEKIYAPQRGGRGVQNDAEVSG